MSLNSAVTDSKWSPNYSAGRPAGNPDKIVIHWWGADGQNHQTVVDYLCRAGGNSSAHYVASAGRVTQLVHDYDRAWHAGPLGNPRGIGIECRPEMSDADFATVAGLVAAIRDEWGDLPLFPHSHWTATACPGRWRDRLGDLSARADQLRGKATPAAQAVVEVTPTTNDQIAVDGNIGPDSTRKWQAVVGTTVDGVISGQPSTTKPFHHALVGSVRYGRSGSQLIARVQGIVGVAQDGSLGPGTIKAIQARLGVAQDGHFGPDTARALQNRLNTGQF